MKDSCVVLRAPSGISGDMLVTGLAKLARQDEPSINEIVSKIGIPELESTLTLKEIIVDGISGWRAHVELPSEHQHRTFNDIKTIIEKSKMTSRSKQIAIEAFHKLANAESQVHMVSPDKVTFHEVGALDSILDICVAASLYDAFAISGFYCSPLPVCDGTVACAHGLLSTPAPAVLNLLKGVPVYGVDSTGETITPTAIALLKSFDTKFGSWPNIVIEDSVRVYGGKKLPNIPNGAIFARGYYYMDTSSKESHHKH